MNNNTHYKLPEIYIYVEIRLGTFVIDNQIYHGRDLLHKLWLNIRGAACKLYEDELFENAIFDNRFIESIVNLVEKKNAAVLYVKHEKTFMKIIVQQHSLLLYPLYPYRLIDDDFENIDIGYYAHIMLDMIDGFGIYSVEIKHISAKT